MKITLDKGPESGCCDARELGDYSLRLSEMKLQKYFFYIISKKLAAGKK